MIPALILTIVHHLVSPMMWKALLTDGAGHEWRVMNGTLDGSIGRPWNQRPLAARLLKWTHGILRNFMLSVFVLKFLLLWAVILLFKYCWPDAPTNYLYIAIAVGGIWMNQRFNTYLDLVFVLSVFALQKLTPGWFIFLPLISAFAAANRESFVLIFPVLLIKHFWAQYPMPWLWDLSLFFQIFSVVVFGAVWAAMSCMHDKHNHLTCPQHEPGWGLVKANLLNPLTYIMFVFAFWPLVCLHGLPWYYLPSCAVALGANLWYGNMRETALFLNPYVLLIPYMGA
jgi:hypothetical protein